MVGLAVRLERSLVVVDLIKEEMVWIARQVEDVEPLATGLLGRRRAILRDRRQEGFAIGGHNVQIDGVDVHPGRLRLDALAGWKQDETGCRNRKCCGGNGN